MTARYSHSLPYSHPPKPLITSQDFVKALFADPEINKTHRLAAINSINFARILAQITYYFSSYLALIRSPSFVSGATIRYAVPTGNFGNILAGYFAKRMPPLRQTRHCHKRERHPASLLAEREVREEPRPRRGCRRQAAGRRCPGSRRRRERDTQPRHGHSRILQFRAPSLIPRLQCL